MPTSYNVRLKEFGTADNAENEYTIQYLLTGKQLNLPGRYSTHYKPSVNNIALFSSVVGPEVLIIYRCEGHRGYNFNSEASNT